MGSIGRELWTGNTVVSGARPSPAPGINVYIGGTSASGTFFTLTGQDALPVLVSSDGQRALSVSDETATNILNQILKELRFIRIHIETMTGEVLVSEDIEK